MMSEPKDGLKRLLLARVLAGALDLLVMSVVYWTAFMLRFEGEMPLQMVKRALFLWPYVVGGQYSLMALLGVSRFSWRHIGLWEVKRMFVVCALSTAILLIIRLGAGQIGASFLQYVQIPIGVLGINFVLMFLGTTGVRVARRMMVEHYNRRLHVDPLSHRIPTLLIGAGQAGAMVAKEIATWQNLGVKPVGFIDDDPLKSGKSIHGLRVLGTTEQLSEVARDVEAKQVLITIASAGRREIRRIAERCKAANLPAKIIPGVYEIVGGRVNLSRIRDVSIQDLLGRDPVVLEEASIKHVLRGRVVLVTGAAGSIGRELSLQVARYEPKHLVIVDQNETGLFYAERELARVAPDISVTACIADIRDEVRMTSVFERYRPEAVFHAAAYKHVGMMEANVSEALANNVLGTRLLADLAARWSAKQFVLVSTDKAVNPSSVMGASKRLAEMYVQSLAQRSKTLFVAVRFGNVLGSAGSVIPLFREQIAGGGPVTVTHPEMRRYFMTVEEASQLVLQAAGIGRGGEIFILDMGEPVKIVDLARDLITLSGFTVGEDVDIVFTGAKPGEKLFEELSVAVDKADKTRHSKIFIERIDPRAFDELDEQLRSLQRQVTSLSRDDELRRALSRLVPEYGEAIVAEPEVAVPQTAPAPVAG